MTESNVPKIAVLLAAFNGEEWIEEQINSILNQTNVCPSVFISLDVSSDSSLSVCKHFASTYDHVNLLPYGNHFGGAAENFFHLICDVDFSNFDYIAFSDQDDIWLENKISHATNVIEEKGVDVVSSDVLAFWQDGREKLVKKSYPQKRFDFFFEAAGPGCTYVFKREVIQCFKDFLTKNREDVSCVALHDWIIYAYCRTRGFKWHIDEIPLMYYRQHASNQVGINSGIAAFKKRFSLIKNDWYRSEVKKVINLLDRDGSSGFRFDRFFLIKNFFSLRRRPRDAFFLLLMVFFRVF